MPVNPTYPGVYIEEVPSGVRSITGVPTAITAFVGPARRGPVDDPRRITSFADFERLFGGLWADSLMSYAVFHYYQNGGSEAVVVRVHNGATAAAIDLGDGVTLAAANPGAWGANLRARVTHHPSDNDLYNLTVRDMDTGQEERYLNVSIDENSSRRLDRALTNSELVATTDSTALDARPAAHAAVGAGQDPFTRDPADGTYAQAAGGGNGNPVEDAQYTGSEQDKTGIYALLKTDIFNILVMPPISRTEDLDPATLGEAATLCQQERAMLIVDPPSDWDTLQAATSGRDAFFTPFGDAARNAALYFPWIRLADPALDGMLNDFPPSGAVAGVYARTDARRGVWKAPAGTEATLNGVRELEVKLSDLENGQLNPVAVNCLRTFPIIGNVVWGARTMDGADQSASEWKYVPVRRLALFIEESLYRGTQWVVFEPNDEPLWGQIRLNVGAFMQRLFQQGAFQGSSAREAYFVKCDRETTTQADINLGIVNIIVGFAPLKPAEFVILKLQQMAGQLDV